MEKATKLSKTAVVICLHFQIKFKMESQRSAEIVEIKPNVKLLSAAELTAKRHVEVEPLRSGLKRSLPTDKQTETLELKQLYENLRKQLSVPRIERLGARSLAIWDADSQAVCVLRKEGKFDSFGNSRNGKQYLENFEALFLLELGRLQLEYNSMAMSIEQAYLLLLGEAASPKYNEYLVYSALSRAGYILVKYDARRYYERTEVTQMDCVWALLQCAVQSKDVPDSVAKSSYYTKVKSEMKNIKNSIMQQKHDTIAHRPNIDNTSEVNFARKISASERKRSADGALNASEAKRCRTTTETHTSFVDFLRDEPEYEQFKQIFNKFDIIKLQTVIANVDYGQRKLSINFDLHLHNDGFKKSTPKLPNYRVIILEPAASFPTHAEISCCYHRQQQHAVPLLIISVSESKQIQAFLYYFS